MTSRPSSTKLRRECFDDNKWADANGKVWLTCHLCKLPIDPVREKWEAEHPTPHANGGTIVLPAHPSCHRPKTAKDVTEIAKGKRVRDRHFGIKRSTGSFPGSRTSKWKKKIDGTIVER